MTKVRSKSARQQFIVDVLSKQAISTQDQLREVLVANGYEVTQATLSRDLDELGAIKVAGAVGPVYAVAQPDTFSEVTPAARLAKVAGEVMTSVAVAGNLVVVHTLPGAAHFLASALDRDSWPMIVGSVAGDDTVMVAVSTPEAANDVESLLAGLVSDRRSRQSRSEKS